MPAREPTQHDPRFEARSATRHRPRHQRRDVLVVGYEGAELLDITCLTTPLTVASGLGAEPPYAIRLATPGGHPITDAAGLTLQAHGALERVQGPLDSLVIAGGSGHENAADDARVTGHIRRLARESRRTASVCTGATVLAATGLLDGKRATTHWAFARGLAERYPAVEVDPSPIYVRDGGLATAAGVTSALDLALAFIEEDHGPALARRVARGLVTYLQRPGNQAQMSMYTTAPTADHEVVRRTVGHIAEHLADDLSLPTLAAHAGVSTRHLARLFTTHLRQSPARYIRHARTEAAAHLIAGSSLPLSRIAARCGFRSAEALRQSFRAQYGVPPSHYRATQRG